MDTALPLLGYLLVMAFLEVAKAIIWGSVFTSIYLYLKED